MKTTKKESTQSIDKETQEDIRKLVMARIKAASDDLAISIGSKEYTKEEMLKSIETGSELGQEIIEIQMEYLKDIAQGAIYLRNND